MTLFLIISNVEIGENVSRFLTNYSKAISHYREKT